MKKIIVLVLAGFVLIACGEPTNQLIVYVENEDGVDPYRTRIIVTPKFIRFDEGDGSTTFLLFDRTTKIAHSVNHEMKTTMQVHDKNIKAVPPMELKHTLKIVEDEKPAPPFNDIIPIHRQHSTNGQVCFEVFSVKGLMPEAVEAMKEFHMVLASDSADTFAIIPADVLNACDISMSTFAPTRQFEHGFPVQEWKEGYSRSLVEYDDDYLVAPGVMDLPTDYFIYSVQEYREGRVDIANKKVLSDADIEAMNKTGAPAAEVMDKAMPTEIDEKMEKDMPEEKMQDKK